MCPLKNLTCAGWFWYQCATDSMINREAAESHTGLAAFSTIYEKQMSQNQAGPRPGLFTDTLVSCSSVVSVCILKSIQWYHNCYCRFLSVSLSPSPVFNNSDSLQPAKKPGCFVWTYAGFN